jgi:Domain of unknown function (DUF4375)
MDDPLLAAACDYAFKRLEDADGSLTKLPLALQTVVVVTSAQGVIDNGGLEYFYENDYPHNPPYSLFVAAYRRIGALEAADCIEQTAAMFPFRNPHFHHEKRRGFMEREASPQFRALSGRICGDKTVWGKVADYVKQNRAAFKLK